MLAGNNARMDRFIHGAGHTRQFPDDFIQGCLFCFHKMAEKTHIGYRNVIAQGIRYNKNDFVHGDYESLSI